MRSNPLALLSTAAAAMIAGCAADRAVLHADARSAAPIETLLDTLHATAAKPDGEAYFACFTPDAVFLGTDATERWTIPQFRAYAEPFFSQGKGWTYTPTRRHIAILPDGRSAFFDELLENAKYGTCRGSGVVLLRDGAWRIAQYNLTFTIPNDKALAVMDVVRGR
jgi:hypothetical protein